MLKNHCPHCAAVAVNSEYNGRRYCGVCQALISRDPDEAKMPVGDWANPSKFRDKSDDHNEEMKTNIITGSIALLGELENRLASNIPAKDAERLIRNANATIAFARGYIAAMNEKENYYDQQVP